MNKLIPLMQREWLQHRFAWAVMTLLPLALAVLLLVFGQVHIGNGELEHAGDAMPGMLAMAAIAGSTCVVFGIAWFAGLINISGLGRRDHADRSIEFWMSVPVSHARSFAAPLLVHLLIVPAAALLIGLLGGYVLSLVLVTRVAGVGAWLGLPWGDILPASVMVLLRLLAGLPLATLWLAPLVLLVVLLTAEFRRWGWVILGVGMGLGGSILKLVFGQPWLNEITSSLLRHAGRAMVNGGGGSFQMAGPEGSFSALQGLPAWALNDYAYALRDLASPLLLGGLLFAASCFALLVNWRRRGAGIAGG